MKRLLLSILTFASMNVVNGQTIYAENFTGFGTSFTANGWTLINNDGLTPATSVSYVTDAWIVREDFVNSSSDSCAISTSWYTPAGVSDDWMITPSIVLPTGAPGIQLSWDAMAPDALYPDGYEVLISTTTPTIGAFTPIFTLGAEASSWTSHTVDITAYAGQNIYLAWRNNSTDMFLLFVDNIVVEQLVPYDVSMTDTTSTEYTIVPVSQSVNPIGVNGLISNIGGSAVTNAQMTVNVYDGSMSSVYSATSTSIPTIAPGANAAASVAGYTPTTPDVYTVELISSITEVDGNPSNDTLSYVYVVSDSVYARDNGALSGTLGIGAGTAGQLGQAFELHVDDRMKSVSFFIGNGAGTMVGQPIWATVYDIVGGVPTNVVGETDTLIIDTTTNHMWTAQFNTPLDLTAGNYAVVVNELDSNITIGLTTEIFTTGTTWVQFATNPWDHNESYSFFNTYILRPNLIGLCTPTASSITESACDSYTSPSGMIYTTTGVFNDTIMNAAGCDSVITVDLTITTINNAVTVSGAVISASANTGTYQWLDCDNGNTPISGATNQTYTATISGNYAVVINENGCSDTSACTYVDVVGIDEILSKNQVEVFPNPSSGTFIINVQDLYANTVGVEILDLNGRIIYSNNYETSNGQITANVSLPNVDSGTYLVKVSVNGSEIIEKVVISKK